MASIRRRKKANGRTYFIVRSQGRSYGAGWSEVTACELLLHFNEIEGLAKRMRAYKGPGFVYFVANRRAAAIKIGFSTYRGNRMSSLQTACSDKLEMLLEAPGSRDFERELHQRFSPLRISGEWFRMTPALVAFIEHLGRCKLEPPLKPVSL